MKKPGKSKIALRRIHNRRLIVTFPLIFLLFVSGALFWNKDRLSPATRSLVPFRSAGAPFPERRDFVTDAAGVLSESQAEILSSSLSSIFERSGLTFYVLLIERLPDTSIEDYSRRLFEAWRPGAAGEDRGLLFVIVTGQRISRFEVGYGLEGDFPDIAAHSVLRLANPHFAAAEWFQGIQTAVNEVSKKLSLPADSRGEGLKRTSGDRGDFARAAWWQKAIGLIFFLAVLLIGFLSLGPLGLVLLFGRPGGVIAGAIFCFLFPRYAGQWAEEWMAIGIFAGVLALNLGLCLFLPQVDRGAGGRINFRYGGLGGLGGRSTGGFFGGRSGGGGATGRW